MTLFPKLLTTSISEPATVRLIPNSNHKPPVLSPLVDDDNERYILEQFEGRTNNRLKAMHSGLPELDKRELAYGTGYGMSHINAAFSYPRKPEGNRFNDSERGAWYCALDNITAIEEVAYHRTRELDRIGKYEDEFIYQELLAGFIGPFYDAQKLPRDKGILGEEPKTAYPSGQDYANQIRAKGGNGIIYPSVRRPGGICLVAFRPQVIQNVRPGNRWKISWNGSRKHTAVKISE